MFCRPNFLSAAICSIGFTFSQASAQEVQAPSLDPGDKWTYQFSLDGVRQWDYTEAVRSVDGTTAVIVTTDSQGRRTIVTFDTPTHRYLIRYAVGRGGDGRGRILGDESANSAPIKFPINLGDEWFVAYRFKVNGDSITQEFHAKVVGREAIRVAAGQFDVYKIEFNGFWQNDEAIGFGGKARQVETYWYSPSVKRFVRREIKSYGTSLAKMAAAVIYWRVDELSQFSLVPAAK